MFLVCLIVSLLLLLCIWLHLYVSCMFDSITLLCIWLHLCVSCMFDSISISDRKLRCPRNTIHINLFISFMLRAALSLLRNTVLVRHFALPSDISYTEDGSLFFLQEGTVMTTLMSRKQLTY